MFPYAYTVEEAREQELDLVMPGWEIDEQTHDENGRYVREGDMAFTDEDDADFREAYDAWREDTFDPDFPIG